MTDDPPFERVYTMTDYYDGPRRGIANFRGAPHAYSCPFDFVDEAFEDLYELRFVDEETLRLALDDWEIWLRFEAAYKAGLVAKEPWGALPDERARHDAIEPILAARLDALPGRAIRARGKFRAVSGHDHAGGGRGMEVQWTVEET